MASVTNVGVRQVVQEGFCIGCGACTVKSAAARIVFNPHGELVAQLGVGVDAGETSRMDAVCPFSSTAPNETVLAEQAFRHEKDIEQGDEIGFFTGLYAGHSETYRKAGSSGGIVTWVLAELLERGMVDRVIVVGRAEGERFFDFRVVDNPAQLLATGTSCYYPVSYDAVLKYIMETPGRYAITGVPCFHKALRQLKLTTPLLAERIVYQVGIVCGQMKSAFYLDYLARKTGADSAPLQACFRRKDETARADDYLFEASFATAAGALETRRVRNREIGANWAMGLFKPRACDFCDDVFAETADIAVMDAWLDRYVNDGRGTSLVIARTAALRALLEQGGASAALRLEAVTESDMVESQRGGLNHRRAGLRYRLLRDAEHGMVPAKRVLADGRFDIWFRTEQRIRSAIRERSRDAMRKQRDSAQGGLDIFDREMRPVLALYKWFGRIRRRVARRRDYAPRFKLDL